MNFSLSTSQANGGCQSWEDSKREKANWHTIFCTHTETDVTGHPSCPPESWLWSDSETLSTRRPNISVGTFNLSYCYKKQNIQHVERKINSDLSQNERCLIEDSFSLTNFWFTGECSFWKTHIQHIVPNLKNTVCTNSSYWYKHKNIKENVYQGPDLIMCLDLQVSLHLLSIHRKLHSPENEK